MLPYDTSLHSVSLPDAVGHAAVEGFFAGNCAMRYWRFILIMAIRKQQAASFMEAFAQATAQSEPAVPTIIDWNAGQMVHGYAIVPIAGQAVPAKLHRAFAVTVHDKLAAFGHKACFVQVLAGGRALSIRTAASNDVHKMPSEISGIQINVSALAMATQANASPDNMPW